MVPTSSFDLVMQSFTTLDDHMDGRHIYYIYIKIVLNFDDLDDEIFNIDETLGITWMASMKLVKKFDERDDEIFTMDEIYLY